MKIVMEAKVPALRYLVWVDMGNLPPIAWCFSHSGPPASGTRATVGISFPVGKEAR